MAPADQAIDQLVKIINLVEYEKRRSVIEFWKDQTPMMVKAKRQISSMIANIHNFESTHILINSLDLRQA